MSEETIHLELDRSYYHELMEAHRLSKANPTPITNPVAMLVRAGWKFSAYESVGGWQVWAKHPLGGACMIAELTRIGRTGFDVKATAEAVAEFLNRI